MVRSLIIYRSGNCGIEQVFTILQKMSRNIYVFPEMYPSFNNVIPKLKLLEITLFLYKNILLFRPRLNVHIFLPMLGRKYSCDYDISVCAACHTYALHVPSIEMSLPSNIRLVQVFFFVLLVSFAV